jgi:hypothetical protein
MSRKAKKKTPDIVFREGKPMAVILDIDEYQELLERLEDKHDMQMLEEMGRRPLKFRKLDDFLKEHSSGV